MKSFLRTHFIIKYKVFVTDIDDCAIDTHTCDAMATCMNTLGSYECTCNEGYEGDGFMCTGKA